MTIGVGLLGLGKHGRRYAQHLAQGDLPGAHLAAVWRRDPVQGQADATLWGTAYCASPEALLLAPGVTAVVAAVPAGLHAQLALQVAAAGLPLLLEKPLAPDVATGAAIVEAFRQSGKLLTVAQTLRLDPLLIALGEALNDLGALRGFGFEQRLEPRGLVWEDDPALAGGGVLFQTAVHTVDALRVLTRPQRVEVLGCQTAQVHYRQLEDHALLQLRLSGGPYLSEGPALGDLRVSKIGGSRHHRFALYAEGGGLEADFIERTLTVTRGRSRTSVPVPEQPTVVRMLSAFLGALERGGPSPIPGEDALETLRVLEAARSAAQRSGGSS